MAPDEFDDNPLEPAEQLDSDQVRNDDGDEVVDPPQEWIEAEDHETLDERLAEETPDVSPRDWGHSLASGGPTRLRGTTCATPTTPMTSRSC